MKSKVLVKLIVVLIASAVILFLGTTMLTAGGYGGYGGPGGLYGGRSTDSDLKFAYGLYGMYGGLYGMYGGLYGMYGGLYGGRSNSSVYEAKGARVKFNKSNPDPLSSFGLIPFF